MMPSEIIDCWCLDLIEIPKDHAMMFVVFSEKNPIRKTWSWSEWVWCDESDEPYNEEFGWYLLPSVEEDD